VTDDWTLVVARPAAQAIERLPDKVAPAVLETLHVIRAKPYVVGKPLRFQLEGLWVARRGPYRVIYAIDRGQRTITVVAIGHRSDIYRTR
jgi:mRNA interferase RelE/StbE